MNKRNLYKSAVFSLLGIAALTSYASDAPRAGGIDLTGSHHGIGILGKKTEVEIILKPIAGREGSYLAVVLRPDRGFFSGNKPKRVVIFRVDPLRPINPDNFDMTPLNVTSDGIIGVPNVEPTNRLSINGVASNGKPLFTISSANNPDNPSKFGDVNISFDQKESSIYNWVSLIPLKFERSDDSCQKAEISSEDPIEFEAQSTLSIKDLSGSYTFQENQPMLFALKANSLRSTGSVTEIHPRKIGLFLTRNQKNPYFVLVNPEDDKDVIFMEKD